jgi:hypothetical protein
MIHRNATIILAFFVFMNYFRIQFREAFVKYALKVVALLPTALGG